MCTIVLLMTFAFKTSQSLFCIDDKQTEISVKTTNSQADVEPINVSYSSPARKPPREPNFVTEEYTIYRDQTTIYIA